MRDDVCLAAMSCGPSSVEYAAPTCANAIAINSGPIRAVRHSGPRKNGMRYVFIPAIVHFSFGHLREEINFTVHGEEVTPQHTKKFSKPPPKVV